MVRGSGEAVMVGGQMTKTLTFETLWFVMSPELRRVYTENYGKPANWRKLKNLYKEKGARIAAERREEERKRKREGR